MIAPEHDQSGVSHSLSLNDPLRLRQIGERHYAVKGTPTDCVIMGARHVMPEPPDLVLSGVNRGRNAAEDVLYSGTVAGGEGGRRARHPVVRAVAGLYLGEQAAAVLADRDRPRARHHPHACSKQGIPRDVLVNVNFPDCPPGAVKGISVSTQGKRDQQLLHIDARHDGRGNPYYWIAYARGVNARPARTAPISPRSPTTASRSRRCGSI